MPEHRQLILDIPYAPETYRVLRQARDTGALVDVQCQFPTEVGPRWDYLRSIVEDVTLVEPRTHGDHLMRLRITPEECSYG
jgi:hypothetical protein